MKERNANNLIVCLLSSFPSGRMDEQNVFISDETNYRITLQTYLKYVQQLPPQREWMKNVLGPRLT